MTNEVKAEGFAYSPATGDWTERVEYVARDRMEAIRWMNFNRDWMKNLRILPADGEGPFTKNRPLKFYAA
jgi:hypothetical protein